MTPKESGPKKDQISDDSGYEFGGIEVREVIQGDLPDLHAMVVNPDYIIAYYPT